MFVNRSMTKEVITISPDTDVFSALDLMLKHHIRHLPVIREDGYLVGIITDRDLRSAIPHAFFKAGGDGGGKKHEKGDRAPKTESIMTTDLIKISPLDTIQDALLLIQRSRVGALPVVDEQNKLQGIISVRDLLRAFINVLGIGEPGTLLCILVEEKVGQLKKIVDAITEEGISLGSVLVARYWDEKKRAVFCYLLTLNVRGIKEKLADLDFTLLDPMEWYMDQLPTCE
jgi:acetoin utilization protein AcuB